MRSNTGLWSVCFLPLGLLAQEAPEAFEIPSFEVEPLTDRAVSLRMDGQEFTRWHGGDTAPRPFFFPFNGPSGVSLTRMGHPGAPNHDHHRSIWFASHDVDGIDFWSDQTDARIRQTQWLVYEDGAAEGVVATRLHWIDPDGGVRIEQDVVAAIRQRTDGTRELELQLTLRPGPGSQRVVLGQTNFGLLAIRVAKSISGHFGGGVLTDSEGRAGEQAIFGQRARWMDYSGPIIVGVGNERRVETEGITVFDHPSNPRYPTRWHVRDDGWMGASFCYDDPWTIDEAEPLRLRYLIVAHAGGYSPEASQEWAEAFAARASWILERSTRPHRQFAVERSED